MTVHTPFRQVDRAKPSLLAHAWPHVGTLIVSMALGWALGRGVGADVRSLRADVATLATDLTTLRKAEAERWAQADRRWHQMMRVNRCRMTPAGTLSCLGPSSLGVEVK